VKRILFIKLGAIGDVIQAAAAVEEFKQLHPEIKIDWVVGKAIAGLLQEMAVADRVIVISDQALFTGPIIRRMIALITIWMHMLAQMRAYQQIYIAHTAWQYGLLAVPIYFRNPRFFFTKIPHFFPRLNQYRVSEYLKFICGKELTYIQGSQTLQSLGTRLLLAGQWSKESVLDQLPEKKWIALVPGGSKNLLRDDALRRWPIEYYLTLSQRLLEEGYALVLLGGPDDAWASHFFAKLPVINLIGKTSLVQLVKIFSKASVIITHDTGPLHLATLTATPLVTLFGPTPAVAVAPLGRSSMQIFTADASVTCAPCYDGFSYAVCDDAICMKSISVDAVLQSVNELTHS